MQFCCCLDWMTRSTEDKSDDGMSSSMALIIKRYEAAQASGGAGGGSTASGSATSPAMKQRRGPGGFLRGSSKGSGSAGDAMNVSPHAALLAHDESMAGPSSGGFGEKKSDSSLSGSRFGKLRKVRKSGSCPSTTPREGDSVTDDGASTSMMFGGLIEDIPTSAEDDFVPLLVQLCVKVLEARGLDAVGIYRIPGNSAAVNSLIAKLNKGFEHVDFKDPRWRDVNVVSSLLKAFFRKLMDPLLTDELYSDFIDANRINNHVNRLKMLKQLVNKLPRHNRDTIEYLMLHLSKVVAHSDVNKMEARNLALMFGPSLVRPRGDSMSMMVNHMPDQCQIVESLIVYSDWFFIPIRDPLPPPPSRNQPTGTPGSTSSSFNDMTDLLKRVSKTEEDLEKSKDSLLKSIRNVRRNSRQRQTMGLEGEASSTDDGGSKKDSGYAERNIDEEIALRSAGGSGGASGATIPPLFSGGSSGDATPTQTTPRDPTQPSTIVGPSSAASVVHQSRIGRISRMDSFADTECDTSAAAAELALSQALAGDADPYHLMGLTSTGTTGTATPSSSRAPSQPPPTESLEELRKRREEALFNARRIFIAGSAEAAAAALEGEPQHHQMGFQGGMGSAVNSNRGSVMSEGGLLSNEPGDAGEGYASHDSLPGAFGSGGYYHSSQGGTSHSPLTRVDPFRRHLDDVLSPETRERVRQFQATAATAQLSTSNAPNNQHHHQQQLPRTVVPQSSASSSSTSSKDPSSRRAQSQLDATAGPLQVSIPPASVPKTADPVEAVQRGLHAISLKGQGDHVPSSAKDPFHQATTTPSGPKTITPAGPTRPPFTTAATVPILFCGQTVDHLCSGAPSAASVSASQSVLSYQQPAPIATVPHGGPVPGSVDQFSDIVPPMTTIQYDRQHHHHQQHQHHHPYRISAGLNSSEETLETLEELRSLPRSPKSPSYCGGVSRGGESTPMTASVDSGVLLSSGHRSGSGSTGTTVGSGGSSGDAHRRHRSSSGSISIGSSSHASHPTRHSAGANSDTIAGGGTGTGTGYLAGHCEDGGDASPVIGGRDKNQSVYPDRDRTHSIASSLSSAGGVSAGNQQLGSFNGRIPVPSEVSEIGDNLSTANTADLDGISRQTASTVDEVASRTSNNSGDPHSASKRSIAGVKSFHGSTNTSRTSVEEKTDPEAPLISRTNSGHSSHSRSGSHKFSARSSAARLSQKIKFRNNNNSGADNNTGTTDAGGRVSAKLPPSGKRRTDSRRHTLANLADIEGIKWLIFGGNNNNNNANSSNGGNDNQGSRSARSAQQPCDYQAVPYGPDQMNAGSGRDQPPKRASAKLKSSHSLKLRGPFDRVIPVTGSGGGKMPGREPPGTRQASGGSRFRSWFKEPFRRGSPDIDDAQNAEP